MEKQKKISAKRVDIVSLKIVRERSFLYENRRINNPSEAYNLVQNFLKDSDREKFLVLCLDTRKQPVSIQVVSVGSLSSTIVHPREVFKIAVLSNASSIICFHNHPTGNSKPSKEDEDMTLRLKESGEILGIPLVDHIVIGSNDSFYSFKENCKI